MTPQTFDEPTFHCVECKDEPAAWRMFWCRGDGDFRKAAHEQPTTSRDLAVRDCLRTKPHYAHHYVERCACSATNPVIAEHRARQEAFRVKRETKPKRGGE